MSLLSQETFMRRSLRRSPAPLPALAFTLVLLVASAIGAAPVRATVGEAGFSFMKIGVGARPMGMGSAYVALAGDPTAVYWNPAGLAGADGAQVIAMHNEWILDFKQEFAAVSRPVGSGAFGLGIAGFYAGNELDGRDEVGNQTGPFGFNDLAVTGSYARRITSRGALGVSAKFIREMIDQEDATAVAFDLGGRLALGTSGVTLGAALQNLGGNAKFEQQSFPLPRTVRAGAAVSRPISGLNGIGTLSAELRDVRGDNSKFSVGGEFEFKERLALRAGTKFGYDDENVSFGVGLMHRRVRFDYALVPHSSDLGTTHFFSLAAKL
jgi:uncharacterized protein UPF0164